MFLWIRNLFTVRKAVFNWTSNKGKGEVKIPFRGNFSQADAHLDAVIEIAKNMRDPDEILESLDFAGIEA